MWMDDRQVNINSCLSERRTDVLHYRRGTQDLVREGGGGANLNLIEVNKKVDASSDISQCAAAAMVLYSSSGAFTKRLFISAFRLAMLP